MLEIGFAGGSQCMLTCQLITIKNLEACECFLYGLLQSKSNKFPSLYDRNNTIMKVLTYVKCTVNFAELSYEQSNES